MKHTCSVFFSNAIELAVALPSVLRHGSCQVMDTTYGSMYICIPMLDS